jgi:2,3-dihydroxybiphenyl 1,2-dioxygenase
MHIKALGYVGVRAPRSTDWVELGTRLLGMQLAQCAEEHATFRMDERQQRLTVVPGEGGGVAFLGWEVQDEAALRQLCELLDRHHVGWQRGCAELAALRGVTGLVIFRDPLGNQLEAYWGALAAETPFQPGRTISGFVTGDLGIGHIALTVSDMEPMIAFYRDVLGFETSDWVVRPFAVHFFHVNARHHSFALVHTGKNGVHHLMMELLHLDDVGQAYDRAQLEPGRLSVTLGRHSNDLMTSFYVNTPSDFLLEYGWGGLNIEADTWQTRELVEGPSLWGHERSWLPPEGRAAALRMRLKAADDGLRAPVQVLPGNHRVTDPSRPPTGSKP